MTTQTESRSSSNGAASRPVKEIRMGRIRAAIWQNSTVNGIRFNVSISRLYKDGEQWRDSTSFGRDDLPIAQKILDRCHSWIFAQNGTPSDNDVDNTPF